MGTLTSQELSFEIAPPSDEQFKTMLAELEIQKIEREKTWKKALDICYQLGEIRNPDAIKALQALAEYSHLADFVRPGALRALANFSQSKLTPMWLELLDDRSIQEIVIDALTKIEDLRAIEPLRHLIFSGSDNPIKVALALKEL